MAASRFDQLIQYYKDDPNDPFNAFALALEYLKSDPTETKKLFDFLLDKHEDYTPVYYHAGRLYQEMEMKEKAMALYEKGILIAKKHNDTKAARELKSALDELIMDEY